MYFKECKGELIRNLSIKRNAQSLDIVLVNCKKFVNIRNTLNFARQPTSHGASVGRSAGCRGDVITTVSIK